MRDASRMAALLARMRPGEQVRFLLTLTRPALLAVHRRFGLNDPDCDCPEVPCRHQRTPEGDPLADPVKTWLLWHLWPAAYGDPVDPVAPSNVLLAQAKVEVMRERARAKRGLWHAGDLFKRRRIWEDEPDEALKAEREVRRLRNGAPVAGRIESRQHNEQKRSEIERSGPGTEGTARAG